MIKPVVFLLFSLLLLSAGLAAGYEFKEIVVRPAVEYGAHQNFQNVSIGAEAFNTEEEVLQILDTKKLCQRYLMAVLIVVENNNDFAVELREEDIYLISADGTNIPTIPASEALLTVSLKKSPSEYPDPKALAKAINKDMRLDFERKAFSEKLIAPGGTDYGLVFFPLLDDEQLRGTRLYFPEIRNMTSGENLMFFEFSLDSSAGVPPSQ